MTWLQRLGLWGMLLALFMVGMLIADPTTTKVSWQYSGIINLLVFIGGGFFFVPK